MGVHPVRNDAAPRRAHPRDLRAVAGPPRRPRRHAVARPRRVLRRGSLRRGHRRPAPRDRSAARHARGGGAGSGAARADHRCSRGAIRGDLLLDAHARARADRLRDRISVDRGDRRLERSLGRRTPHARHARPQLAGSHVRPRSDHVRRRGLCGLGAGAVAIRTSVDRSSRERAADACARLRHGASSSVRVRPRRHDRRHRGRSLCVLDALRIGSGRGTR